MRASAAPGVCSWEHVWVEGRGAGRSIDAGGLGGGEQFPCGSLGRPESIVPSDSRASSLAFSHARSSTTSTAPHFFRPLHEAAGRVCDASQRRRVTEEPRQASVL
jgi:hypothetical protein